MKESVEKITGAILPEDEARAEQVHQIVARDKAAFNKWLEEPDSARRLDLPFEALRYVVMPERLLELAEKPETVRPVVLGQGPDYLNLILAQKKSEAVTERGAWERYLAESKASFGEVKSSGAVDYYHREYRHLVLRGDIGLDDLVANHICLWVHRDDQLYVHRYGDRKELRGKGVAMSFYARLREAAIRMGFRFIKGQNNEKNVGFFTGKLGRSTLLEVKPELRSQFMLPLLDETLKVYTIDFLVPEDREKFLIHV